MLLRTAAELDPASAEVREAFSRAHARASPNPTHPRNLAFAFTLLALGLGLAALLGRFLAFLRTRAGPRERARLGA